MEAKFNFSNVFAAFIVTVALFYLFFYQNGATSLTKLTTPEQINAAIQLASNDSQIRTFAISMVTLIVGFYWGASKNGKTSAVAASGTEINTDKIITDKIENKEEKGEVTIYKDKSIVRVGNVYRAMGSEYATLGAARAAIDSSSTER